MRKLASIRKVADEAVEFISDLDTATTSIAVGNAGMACMTMRLCGAQPGPCIGKQSRQTIPSYSIAAAACTAHPLTSHRLPAAP